MLFTAGFRSSTHFQTSRYGYLDLELVSQPDLFTHPCEYLLIVLGTVCYAVYGRGFYVLCLENSLAGLGWSFMGVVLCISVIINRWRFGME